MKKRAFLKEKRLNNLFFKYKKYDFVYDDENALKSVVIDLLGLLRQDLFVVKLFSSDDLNGVFALRQCQKFSSGNFNYYVLNDDSALAQIDFCDLRFMEILLINESDFGDCPIKDISKKSSTVLSLDNYLETTELIINPKKYAATLADLLSDFTIR